MLDLTVRYPFLVLVKDWKHCFFYLKKLFTQLLNVLGSFMETLVFSLAAGKKSGCVSTAELKWQKYSTTVTIANTVQSIGNDATYNDISHITTGFFRNINL